MIRPDVEEQLRGALARRDDLPLFEVDQVAARYMDNVHDITVNQIVDDPFVDGVMIATLLMADSLGEGPITRRTISDMLVESLCFYVTIKDGLEFNDDYSFIERQWADEELE